MSEMKNEKYCKVVWRNDKNSVQYIEQIVIKNVQCVEQNMV